MAYFRCGGGGIPSSLKTDMNAVLNKKFGTSTDYPPADWAPTVNLMGPLPEKTQASAPVCSFDDGADDVPTKSLVVTIPPTLDGKSEVTETQTGKNLLDTAIAETKSNNSVNVTCDGNGKYTATGTATGGSANITFTLKTPCTIQSGMYLHLMNRGANASASITLQKQDNTIIYAPALSPANRIADLSSYAGQTIYSIRFYVVNGASFEMTLTPMLCYSNTETTFEPYQTPTVYTASLGRTIYGGSVDFVSGEVVKKNSDPLTFDGSENWKADTTRNGVYLLFSTMGTQNFGDGACNMFTTIKSGSGMNSLGICFGINNYAIYIPHLFDGGVSGVSDISSWKTYLQNNDCTIVYPLATPTDFTFTGQEIPTRLGYNAFWSDEGNTEVTYRADIDLLLGGN